MLPVLEVSQTPGLAGQLDTRNGVERRKEASSMKATVRNMKRQITALQDTNVKLHKRCRVAERQAGIVEDTTDELRIIVHDPRTLYAVMARCKVKKLKRADFDPPLTRVHSCLPPTGSSRRMKEPCALHCYMRLEVGPVQLGKPPVRILSRFGKQTREVQKHVGSSDALIAHSLFSADARREGANGAARLSTDGRCTTVKGRPTPKRVSPD